MWRPTNLIVVLLLIALCWQFKLTNSRTSTFWKLNANSGKITTNQHAEEADQSLPFDAASEVYVQDEVFYIIASTLNKGSNWVRQSPDNSLESLMIGKSSNGSAAKKQTTANIGKKRTAASYAPPPPPAVDDSLDCGKPVNFTYYDYLIGVGQRFNHPIVPEPEVAYLFLKVRDEQAYKHFDITMLERRLKRAKKEKPRSVSLYNQIGNYWRIVGDARQAIECFRRALAMSPTNAEVLLNLARVLFHLQYLDDAIHLTRRSLELQPPGRSAWQQYFTLGEIFKSYGHFQESVLHFRHALELFPHHEPILKALRDIENSPSSSVHFYTVVIIIALVIAVCVVILASSKCENLNSSSNAAGGKNSSQNDAEHRTRHFNRAMAMRSLKGLPSTCSFRHKKV